MTTEYQPYVGPLPYERKDQALFFGRDHEANELVSLIISSLEVLFYAQSGVGKTSILNAKVIPLLIEEEGFEVYPLARVQSVIPKGIQPEEIQNLYVFNTLMSWARDETTPRRFAQMTIGEFLNERKRSTDEQGQPLPCALIFDQFEEIFTLYQDRWNDRNEFFKQVRDALKDDNRFLRVIFTIREDYIAQLDPYAPLLPEKLRTRFRMERLRRDAALAAVKEPLRKTKRSFAKGVAEKLVEDLLKTRVETITGGTKDVTGEFVEPVQLQVVCQNLWRELPPVATEITEQHLLAFGGVDRPLSRFYESAVKSAVTEAGIKEEELREWCEKWLITSTGTRGIVHRGPQSTEGIPNTALDILEARHLINSEWRAGARWYELTHDRFIEPIRTSNVRWKQYGRVIEDYDRTLELDSKNVDAYFNRGSAYYALEQYERAIADYDRVLELTSKNVDAYYSRGLAYYELKQYERAIADYDRVLELDPKYVNAYYSRGLAYYDLKHYKRAIADYDRALELDPQYVDAYYSRGLAYYDLKQYERAIEDFDHALELDPKYANAYYMRGLTYLWLRDIEQAQIDLKLSWQLDSTEVNYGWVIEWVNMCQEKPDLETAERLEAIAANDPNNFVAYVCRGVALWIRGSFEEAATELDRAIPLNPEFEDIFFWKGMVHAYLGQDDEAIAAIEKSLELDLPPILLSPLRWVEQDRSDFYQKYAAPLLARLEV